MVRFLILHLTFYMLLAGRYIKWLVFWERFLLFIFFQFDSCSCPSGCLYLIVFLALNVRLLLVSRPIFSANYRVLSVWIEDETRSYLCFYFLNVSKVGF